MHRTGQPSVLPHSLRRRAILAATLAGPAAARAQPQAWPTRSVEIVVPYAAGGPTDRYAREFAPPLTALWGQQAVIANKPGGASAIGTAAVANAPADGHTLLLASFGIVTNPLMLRNLPYDPRALAPLCRFALGGAVLYIHPSVPARTLPELVAWAKENPGRLQFGSSGMGSSPHISAELLAWAAGIDIVHTPYRGSAPALTDLLAGHINALFDSVTTMPFARDGRLFALGICQPARSLAAPELPTMAEQGFPQVMARTFYGFFCPAAVPTALQERIAADLRGVAGGEAIQRLIRDDGLEPMAETPAEFAAFLAEQHAFWSRIVRERKLAL